MKSTLLIGVCFSMVFFFTHSPVASDGAIIEIIDCNGTVVKIKPDWTGIQYSLGKGQVELAWDKIDKVEFNWPSCDWPCDESNKNECYEKYLSSHSINVIFANGDKMKTNFYAFKDCGYNLHGKSDHGEFKINAVYIKTLKVLK